MSWLPKIVFQWRVMLMRTQAKFHDRPLFEVSFTRSGHTGGSLLAFLRHHMACERHVWLWRM